jgi:hypothetical protein
MAKPTDEEPTPTGAADPGRWHWLSNNGLQLPRPSPLGGDFWDVLARRNSVPGHTSITQQQLSTILWHSCLIRERRPARGQLRGWESRSAPSAGGLHEIEILCLPLDRSLPISWYDPLRHRLIPTATEGVSDDYRQVIADLCRSIVGITLQFVADWQRLSTLYANASSLLWRDAGALLTTMSLVAEAANVASTPLGRESLINRVSPTDEPERWRPCGGVHLSGRKQ